MTQSSFYENIWHEEWDDLATYAPVSRHVNRWILKLVHKMPFAPKKILDAGCGNGKLISYLKDNLPDVKFSGTDFSQSGVDICQKRYPEFSFKHQDLTDLSNPFGELADLIICSEVIEHIKDDDLAIKTLSLMGRYVLITVPGGNLDELAKSMGHYRHYTLAQLITKFKKHNLSVVKSKVWGFPISWPIYAWFRNKYLSKSVTGKYSPIKQFITHILYRLFFINDLFNAGNNIFVLFRNDNIKTNAS